MVRMEIEGSWNSCSDDDVSTGLKSLGHLSCHLAFVGVRLFLARNLVTAGDASRGGGCGNPMRGALPGALTQDFFAASFAASFAVTGRLDVVGLCNGPAEPNRTTSESAEPGSPSHVYTESELQDAG